MAEDVRFSDTVMGRITKDALMNPKWNDLPEQEAIAKVEELGSASRASDEITYGSELASVEGIAQILGLTDEEKNQMINDINTKDAISDALATKMKTQLTDRGLNASIVEILSVIHDNWVKGNGKKFENPKRMDRLYQFVDLKLLDYDEAKLDLLFLKPILEAAGIEIDENALNKEFLDEQKLFLDTNGIKNANDLKAKLQEGAAFYPALEGIRGATGDLVTDRLALEDGPIADMTAQVAKRAKVSERTVTVNEVQETAETLTSSKYDAVTTDIKNSETPVKDDKAVEEQGE